MSLGFIMFYPVRLFNLLYIITVGDMVQAFNRGKEWISGMFNRAPTLTSTSGNAAFDFYREETLRRLQEEQNAFGDFMERLKRACYQEKFERFMNERRTSKN
jgi:hypothetical protein